MREIPRIKPADVKRRMDAGEKFQFIDTRNPQAWAAATSQLPGAIRIPSDEVDQHLAQLDRSSTFVAYCT